MNKCIVVTRHDGGVAIVCPAPGAIRWMQTGGRWGDAPKRGWLDMQIERAIKAGHAPDASRRMVYALQFGGASTAEALAIIRDRDCAHLGTACELIDADDLPQDRWFRDAWTRSHNGGPIRIDLDKARPIQFRHVRIAVDAINRKRQTEMRWFDQPIAVDLGQIRDRINAASDEIELRRVWPQELRA